LSDRRGNGRPYGEELHHFVPDLRGAVSFVTRWETAYDIIVPEGQDIPRRRTWLEAELGLEVPDKAS
jgi:hypothetical protein